MQKLILRATGTMAQGQTFFYNTLAAFDEECIVKRIRVSFATNRILDTDDMGPYTWAIIQCDTLQAPTVDDFEAETRIIATGIFAGGQFASLTVPSPTLLYDHTITMRKLKETAVYLIYAKADDSAMDQDVESVIYSQVHYIED